MQNIFSFIDFNHIFFNYLGCDQNTGTFTLNSIQDFTLFMNLDNKFSESMFVGQKSLIVKILFRE